MMDWALNHFIFNRREIKHILREHQSLGAHTDIIQFRAGKMDGYRWTHVGARPFGTSINPQCSVCKQLGSRKPKVKSELEIVLTCSGCQAETKYTFPHDSKWVDGSPSKGDERGAWLVYN